MEVLGVDGNVDVEELMDLPGLPLPETHSWSPSESEGTSDIADLAEELLPWPGEVKLSLGDLKTNLLGLSVPLGVPLGVPLELELPGEQRTMVGTRKRKGWGDGSCSGDHSGAKMGRDQLLLADCLDNINSDGADLTSVDIRDHKRDSGSALSRSSWPVGDIADHLTADLDGLGVDTYNISEAFLSLPNLTVFKQEAPSPSSNENGVAHMSPLSLGANLVEPEANGASNNTSQSQQHQQSSLHQLLQPVLAPPPHHEPANSGVASQNSPAAQENFCQNSPGGQTTSVGDCRFQYVLAAATSIATKVTEETLTYLNQGQSYEIKLKKLGDLSNYRGKVLKSIIRICFHDRRLQYMEREQITAWQASRPGERIVEVDIPLSYGAFDISQDASQLNTVEFLWDATKEVGVYIKVNCISTEFTPKKHGGEKGVPFRIQVETFFHGDASGKRLHAAACQIKVFKLKGADRKHKQDREKILKRPMQEQDKFQPSYECTVLTDISNEAVAPPMSTTTSSSMVVPNSGTSVVSGVGIGLQTVYPTPEICVNRGAPASVPPNVTTNLSKEEVNQVIGDTQGLPSVGLHTLSTLSAPGVVEPSLNALSSPSYSEPLSSTATDHQTAQWLQNRRFGAHLRMFTSFCGADLLRLSRDDLIQICGLPDGIRLFNALHAKSLTPRLTIYLTLGRQSDGSPDLSSGVFRALYLDALTCNELATRLASHVGLSSEQVTDVLLQGPGGIRVLVTDDVVQHMKNEGLFVLEVLPDRSGERFCLLLKPTPS